MKTIIEVIDPKYTGECSGDCDYPVVTAKIITITKKWLLFTKREETHGYAVMGVKVKLVPVGFYAEQKYFWKPIQHFLVKQSAEDFRKSLLL